MFEDFGTLYIKGLNTKSLQVDRENDATPSVSLSFFFKSLEDELNGKTSSINSIFYSPRARDGFTQPIFCKRFDCFSL